MDRVPVRNSSFEDFLTGKETNKVVDLKLITGGKEPPLDGDWLSPLPDGMIFRVRDKTDPRSFLILEMRKHDQPTKQTVRLQCVELFGNKFQCVIPVQFCNRFAKHEEVGVLTIEEETEETTNDTATRDGESLGEDYRVQGVLSAADDDVGNNDGK